MDEKIAKTITTPGIWFATMIIFVAGVFRFNWTGFIAGMLWFMVALALAIAPAAATVAIWKHSSSKDTPKPSADQAPAK